MPLSPLFLAATAYATVVPGGSLGDTTWSLAGSPYVVQGDVTVLAGATLTIDPGVEVRFAHRFARVWRIHLISAAVAKLRRALRRLAKWTIKPRRILHRIRHDRSVLESFRVE